MSVLKRFAEIANPAPIKHHESKLGGKEFAARLGYAQIVTLQRFFVMAEAGAAGRC